VDRGRRITAAVLQLVAFVTDFGMSPEAAAHQPRIDASDPNTVTADRRLAPDILDARKANAATEVVEHGVLPINFAGPNLVIQQEGMRTGISCLLALVGCGGAGLGCRGRNA
jgi:gamma-glutamyltranspeptidase/glutathione hydrolase